MVSSVWIIMVIESTEQRTRLYFDRWRWCGKFYLPESRSLYGLDHDAIDQALDVRRTWGKRMVIKNHGGSWRQEWAPLEISDQHQQDLHVLCDTLLAHVAAVQIQLHNDHVFVYTNDRRLIDDLAAQGIMRVVGIKVVEIKGDKHTVYLKHSDHDLRSYFRARQLRDQDAHAVKRFLQAQDCVKLSPALRYWCGRDELVYTRRNFFIDHDQPAVINMLSLIASDLIRVTMPIQTHK